MTDRHPLSSLQVDDLRSALLQVIKLAETVDPHQGNLLPDDALLSEKLQAIGVSAQRPVVVGVTS